MRPGTYSVYTFEEPHAKAPRRKERKRRKALVIPCLIDLSGWTGGELTALIMKGNQAGMGGMQGSGIQMETPEVNIP